MLSIEVTIEMTILMKKVTVPFSRTVNKYGQLSRISFLDSTLGLHPNE
jgi:putative transposon-encoded protein